MEDSNLATWVSHLATSFHLEIYACICSPGKIKHGTKAIYSPAILAKDNTIHSEKQVIFKRMEVKI